MEPTGEIGLETSGKSVELTMGGDSELYTVILCCYSIKEEAAQT
jgi:hypothetical protein